MDKISRSKRGIILSDEEKKRLSSIDQSTQLTTDGKNKLIRKLNLSLDSLFDELKIILTTTQLSLWRGGKFFDLQTRIQELNEVLQHSGPQTIYLDKIIETMSKGKKSYYVESPKHPIWKVIELEIEGKKLKTQERIHTEKIYHVENVLRGLKCGRELKRMLLKAYNYDIKYERDSGKKTTRSAPKSQFDSNKRIIPRDDPKNSISGIELKKKLQEYE